MNTTRKCPRCGTELPPEVPANQCPRCLLQVGMGTQVDAGATERVPPPKPPPSPAELAPYFPQLEILELLGQGGMGVVYKARQPRLDRFVALKVLPADPARDPTFAERFAREARALASLSHPNIVPVYDFGETHGIYYFIMEYVDGVNLRQLEREGRLSGPQALRIVPAICEALQYAHDQGIVHRDIKPENILVDKQGRVKIADFGLAKLLGRGAQQGTLTEERQVMGTPHYMAPEQVEDPQHVDHRADIYSLGVVFYEMLTGELPLGRFAPPSQKVQVDVRLDEVVLHALEKERDRRYQHASEVKTDVETIAAQPPLQPPPLRPPAPVDEWAAVRHSVKGPATGLFVTGIINWLLVPLLVLIGVAVQMRQGRGAMVMGVPVLVLAMVASTFILFAALKMRALEAWGAAVVASVLAMIITPGNLLGLPVGIWALVTLTRRQVREAFRQRPPLPAPPFAIAGTSPDPARRWFFTTATVCLIGLALFMLLAVGGLLASIFIPALVRARQAARAAAQQRAELEFNAGPPAATLEWAPVEPILLRSFDVQDPTLSTAPVVTNNAWLIDSTTNQVVSLFEVPDPDVDQGHLFYRCQLKTEGLQGRAFLEMWCRFPGKGEFFSRGLTDTVSGSTDWSTRQTAFVLKQGEKPDLVKLNVVVEGQGRVWIRDVALLKNP